jgi:Flp pilus assembly pilin Flp
MAHLARQILWLTESLGRHNGQTMAEYGILIAVIAVVVIAAAVLLGGNLSDIFSSTSRRV